MAMAARFDELHDLAAKATGMDDFGTSDYVAPLRHLLDDYDRHNNFPASGEQVIVADLVGQLAGRLFAQSGFKSRPELADAPVEKPLFILGMARTGTTALLRLLSRDPATQSLPLWLAMTPMPRPPRDTWDSHPCYQQVVQGLAQPQLMRTARRLSASHSAVPGTSRRPRSVGTPASTSARRSRTPARRS